jgi:hypothetical protein
VFLQTYPINRSIGHAKRIRDRFCNQARIEFKC